MNRSSNTEKAIRLNAAFNLLSMNYSLSDAADALVKEFELSRRQAYRYLLEAQQMEGPALETAPSIPITIKMPEDVVVRLRSHAQSSGMTIGEIVAHAIVNFLDKLHHHG